MLKVAQAAFAEACQTSTSAWFVFKWLHIPLTSRQVAVIHHMTGLCVICGGENGTNGCYLAVFGEDVAFARHCVATSPALLPCRSASSMGYATKKMAGNSASYSLK